MLRRRLLGRSVGDESCREGLAGKGVVEKCWREVLEKSVVEKCWRKVF